MIPLGCGSIRAGRVQLKSRRKGVIFSDASRSNCTLRFSATPFELGTESATLMRTDSGVLTGPPLVDRSGYRLVTRAGDSIVSLRFPSLVDQSGVPPQVEQCL
ncbi:MAG: hypothetical protein KC776_19550 [Myxococcales bacterium]|nr:hypothetical protein [Myxococcales bacterium]MCB1299561.1 hypothetical protein [Microthrixaceae bacterium]MCB9578893.1 hypothetical protein [Polyangiaceae bacterium]